MTDELRALTDAVLHEGHLLYPYRTSSLKNLYRSPFGTLYPESFCKAQDAGDAASAGVECLLVGGGDARVQVDARFLQAEEKGTASRSARVAFTSLDALSAARETASFDFGSVSVALDVRASAVRAGCWKLSATLRNTTSVDVSLIPTRDDALRHALSSAHLLLRVENGEFVSAIDPPQAFRALVDGCRNAGLWPVLVGEPDRRDALLAAPIILYDYPQIAPESSGDFFDATEVDALLTLRILTLTEDEKREMAESDPLGRELLERTEAMGVTHLASLHGRLSRPALAPGASVRLCPRGRADIFDDALKGKVATVHAIERDLEGRTYVAVTVDDDPGRDLAEYGHRFFFRLDEVELL